jgi:4-hydroxy-2-oxoheptanedioate aldolase
MPAAELKKRWRNGEVTYGANIRLGSPFLAEVLALSGFDFVRINMEHGMNWEHTLMPMIQAMNGTGTTVFVKIPSVDREFIGKMLDLGAEGISCPDLATVEQAREVVACTRHAPEGVRGNTSYYTKYLPGGKKREVLVIGTIESLEGARNAAEITKVDGIDGITIGPGDLAQHLGLPHVETHELRPGPHEDTIRGIMKACQDNGIPYGMSSDGDPSNLKALGCQLITLGSDIGFFERGMKAALAKR